MRDAKHNADGPRWATRLAVVEILLGTLILSWALLVGASDGSSLGEVFSFWSALAAFFCFLVPGLLLLVRRPIRWILQPLPAALIVLVIYMFGLRLIRP